MNQFALEIASLAGVAATSTKTNKAKGIQTRKDILDFIKRSKRSLSTVEVAEKIGICRDHAGKHLIALEAAGKLVRTGSYRAWRYGIPQSKNS